MQMRMYWLQSRCKTRCN